MDNKRVQYLLNNYLAKTNSAEEERELFSLLESEEYDEQVKECMSSMWNKLHNSYSISEEQSEKILASIFANKKSNIVPIHSHRRKTIIVWAAASLLLIAVSATLFYTVKSGSSRPQSVVQTDDSAPLPADIPPGTDGAILTLADGKQIVLDNAPNGIITSHGHLQVIKKGGQIIYNEKGQPAGEVQYNTMTTRRGKQYQLMLADGSKVWLNAASSIRFPISFPGMERRVEITGEAYLEIAKNPSSPFRVTVNGMEVEVLGTHFNVNAYADEASVNTTLLEGSIKITRGGNTGILTPGQQSQVKQNGEIKWIKNADVEEAVAWKNGRLLFNNTDLKTIMRQVMRWYDLDVVYEGNLSDRFFTADISRNTNLGDLLKVLEQSKIHFKIEGRILTVMP
jgi:ferric-dicitrate binding protein FerR (iron transport regulator)